jgi:hypothetical protein
LEAGDGIRGAKEKSMSSASQFDIDSTSTRVREILEQPRGPLDERAVTPVTLPPAEQAEAMRARIADLEKRVAVAEAAAKAMAILGSIDPEELLRAGVFLIDLTRPKLPDFNEARERLSIALLRAALTRSNGEQAEAGRLIGIPNRSRVAHLVGRYGIRCAEE